MMESSVQQTVATPHGGDRWTVVDARPDANEVHVVPTGDENEQHEFSAECFCTPSMLEDYRPVGGAVLMMHRARDGRGGFLPPERGV